MPNIGDKIAVGAVDLSPVLENQWIADLATFGLDSYIAFDVPKLIELSTSPNALNHKIAKVFLLEGIIQGGGDVGAYFTAITGDTTGSFTGLVTMESVINSETAMTAVANSETAMTAVMNNETVMTAVANSETAMTAVANSETAMTVIANSETAMTVVFNSLIAKNIIWLSSTASIILMSSANISRQWMLDNTSQNISITSTTAHNSASAQSTTIDKKGFVLNNSQTNDGGGVLTSGVTGYLGTTGTTTTSATGQRSDRVYILTVTSGWTSFQGTGHTATRTTTFVAME